MSATGESPTLSRHVNSPGNRPAPGEHTANDPSPKDLPMSTDSVRGGLALAAAFLLTATATADAAATRPYDLNGDGRQDLVLGLPWATSGDQIAAGAVAVVDGSKWKL